MESVEWAKSRYDEIVKKTTPFFKQNGYKAEDVVFIPISGLNGDNLKEKSTNSAAEWYTGLNLWAIFGGLTMLERDEKLGFRIPMLEGYRDMGATIGIGKVEQGTVKPGTKAIIMPNKVATEILAVTIDEEDYTEALPGENIRIRLKGVEEEQVAKGFVLCPLKDPVPACTRFKAQLMILELLETRPLITSGYSCVLHVHTFVEECHIVKLYECTDRKKNEKTKNPRFARESNILLCGIQLVAPGCLSPFSVTPQLGRFTLRDEGKTIAIGKVVEVSSK